MRKLFLVFAILPLSLVADTYYWVGGSGNWSTLTHWATTSGGSTYHNTVPGSGDDIIFDASSGTGPLTINANVTTVYGKDFTISANAPAITFNCTAVTLELFGSLTLKDDFVSTISNTVNWNLSGSGSHTIDLGGIEISSLNLNGTGSYTLQDSLLIHYRFKINSGDFDSDGNYLRCEYLETSMGSGDFADFSNSTMLFTGYWNAMNFNSDGIFDFSGSTVLVEGSRARISCNLSDTLQLNEVIYIDGIENEINANNRLKISKLETNATHLFAYVARIDSLNINGGSILSFRQDSNTKIGHITQQTGCVDPIYIQGSENTTGYEINLLNNSVVSNATFVNFNVQGSVLTATNSYDVSGSSGITFSASTVDTYYWIGGDGDWNDGSNWSLSSGGTSANCIPGLLDNVIFDVNSSTADFEVVLPNHAHVGNLISTSDDELVLIGDGWFAINGSLKLNYKSQLNLKQTWNSSEILLTNGSGLDSLISPRLIRGSVSIIGDGGYIVKDSLKVEGILGVVNGSLHMPNAYIEVNYFRDRNYPRGGSIGDSSYADISNSHMVIQGNIEFRKSTFSWDYDSSLVEIVGNYSTCFFDQSQPFWELRFSNPSAQNTIYWDGFEAKIVDIHSSLNIRTYQLDLDWDTLRVQAGALVNIQNDPQTLNTEYIDAKTDCFGFATIQAETKDDSLTINVLSDSLVSTYLLLQNITNGTPLKPIKAYSSIDLGGNVDIAFSLDQPRALYWIGDAGVWQDSTHWSLTSGGQGGECIPTPADSVVFDNNSFSVANQSVDLETYDAYCGDFVITPNTSFNLDWSNQASLQVFRDMVLQPGLQMSGSSNAFLEFKGPDSAYFNPAGVSINLHINIEKSDYATLDVLDSIYTPRSFNVFNGGLRTFGNSYNINSINLEDRGDSTWAEVDSSIFKIWGSWNTFNINSTDIGWKSDGATVYLTSDRSQARIYTLDTVEHIEFTNENSLDYNSLRSGQNSHIHFVKPHANLIFNGPTSIDTLILSPDQVYSFDPDNNHIIHDSLRARGDFCNYIGMKSTQIGTQADLYTYHNVGADFLEIRDLNYVGTGTFYTGAKSNDQGNNTGFIWDNQPGYVYGFPSDTTELFCHDSLYTDSLLLTTANFNDAVGFYWSTGDSTTNLWVSQSGLYWVEADYVTCTVTDTIQVNLDYKSPLQYTSQVCIGDTITLTANDANTFYNYQWSTGDVGPSISLAIITDTTVFVDIYIGNRWVCSDTARIEGVSIDAIATMAANPLCSDTQDGQIDITGIAGGHGPYDHFWSHSPALSGTSATGLVDGCYVITTTDTLGCERMDTVCLIAPPPLSASYSLNQPFCEGDPGSAVLGANGGTPTYSFICNFNTTSIPTGNYSFTVTDTNGCSTDTIFDIAHTFNFNYTVDIDTATCGENNGAVQILPSDPNNTYTYSWSTYPGYTNNGQIFMPVSNGFIYIQDSIAGCIDTVYYEIPAGGVTNAIFLTSQDSGISPLTISTTNIAAAPGLQYTWLINGDTVSAAQDTSFTFAGYGDYLITLCIYDPVFGCQFCFEKWIKVLPNPAFDAPNFFTPNFDGINDFFELVVGQDLEWLEVEVFNRWDQLVFRSNEVDFKWDGRDRNGRKCASSVYFWIITYKEVGNPIVNPTQGTIHLID